VAFDPDGTLWVAEGRRGELVAVTPDGRRRVVVGRRRLRNLDGGPVLATGGLALDDAGRCWFADPVHHRVGRRESDGTCTLAAGTGEPGFVGDGGPAAAARVDRPVGLAWDAAGGALLIADSRNHRVRRIGPDGMITTVAGSGTPGDHGDGGPATAARLHRPAAVAVAGRGPGRRVVVADTGNGRVRAVDAGGTIGPLKDPHGSTAPGGPDGPDDDPPDPPDPAGLWGSPDGSVVVADRRHHVVWRYPPQGAPHRLAGCGRPGDTGDGGPATAACLRHPTGLAADGRGAVWVADTMNHRVRRIGPDGVITTVAGTGEPGGTGDGGPATAAALCFPEAVAVLRSGAVLVADTMNHRVRRIGPDGVITTVAGTGEPGDGDGDGGGALTTGLRLPAGLLADPDEPDAFLVADTWNHRVLRVGADGTATVVAGTGEPDDHPDALAHPRAMAALGGGSVAVADSSNDRVRWFTLAGDPRTGG
jgi:sugar lactone lactonase YvrE